MLTDEEVKKLQIDHNIKLDNACGCGACRERDQPKVFAFAKAIEAAVLAKLRKQEPVAVVVDSDSSESVISPAVAVGSELFTHPTPIPEGFDAWSLNPYTIALQKIMETENHGQDISLLQVLRKFRNRLLQSQPAPIPEGYQLVPIEPTDAMLVYVVGFSSQFANANQFSDTRRSNYKAMLNAAKDTK